MEKKKITDNKLVKKGGSTVKEFKEFISKGNIFDMAVGVIIGGAFGKIVTSLVNDIIMPLISLATGGVDFANWFVALDGNKYATLEEAQAVGAATLNYGNLISVVIDFLIIAVCIFFIVKLVNKLKKKQEEEAPAGPSEEVLLLREIRDSLKKK